MSYKGVALGIGIATAIVYFFGWRGQQQSSNSRSYQGSNFDYHDYDYHEEYSTRYSQYYDDDDPGYSPSYDRYEYDQGYDQRNNGGYYERNNQRCEEAQPACHPSPTNRLTRNQRRRRRNKLRRRKDECTICLEPVSLYTHETLRCNHQFHSKCIIQWRSYESTCPLCRLPI